MTSDSGEAHYAPSPPYESVDETQPSGQQGAVPADAQQAPTPAPDTAGAGRAGSGGIQHSLIADPSGYATRWESIQVGFVDDPRSAVQEAETLVSDVMAEMTAVFQRQRQHLEKQWSGGNQASTEDLRVAFQRYRDFFQRLLQV